MGTIYTYCCINCGFYFEDDKDLFYYDSTLKRTNTYLALILTEEYGLDSKIKGHTTLTQCNYCKNFIRTYYVTKYPDDDLNNLNEIILKGIKNELKYLKEELDKKIKKNKEIKDKANYIIEKEDACYCIYSLESDIEHYVYIDDYVSEEEALETCKNEFFDLLEEEIKENRTAYEIENRSIKKITYMTNNDYFHKTLDKISCPCCNHETYESIIEYCPKCSNELGGEIEFVD